VKRAAVLIGVDRTGDLPVLKDAAKGARRMEEWAIAQGVGSVEVFTDENGGAVDVGAVKKAIKKIVDSGTVEQLVIYFAGHGVNNGYREYWLLSDAPADTQAAVNVSASETLARYSGIPHVVFISDACRTAAQGIRAQAVGGSEVFPNEGTGDLEQPVDQFFACTLGRPAHEIDDPATTTKEYTALYTQTLLDALLGKRSDMLEWAAEGSEQVGYVRPRPLKAYLVSEVAARLKGLNLETKVIQVPDARITSGEEAWIARLAAGDVAGAVAANGGRRPRRRRRASVPETVATVSMKLLGAALAYETAPPLEEALEAVRSADVAEAAGMAESVVLTSTPFGPPSHETQCGFKVRGARIAEAWSPQAETELFQTPGEVVRVNTVEWPGASVLLVFEDGSGVVLPAIPEFLAALTVEDGELVDVAYEPSANSWRWAEFGSRADAVRTLRAVASSSTRNGVFHLEGDDALEVARRMQYSKGVDPTLAIYAAYAYHELQQRDLIRQMSGYMRDDLGARLFDVALLARELEDTTIGTDPQVLSFVPLLAQGWALLPAYRVSLPPSLRGIQQTLLPSVWTMFDARGVERLRLAMSRGEAR
jgi:hypothetical protein